MTQRRIPQQSSSSISRRAARGQNDGIMWVRSLGTYPEKAVSDSLPITPYPSVASYNTQLDPSGTLSIPSSKWVDMFGIYANGAVDISNISLNGKTPAYQNVPKTTGGGYGAIQYFDVMDYGLSATLTLTTDPYFVFAAPALPRTVVTTGGGVVYPEGLAGRTATPDI